MQEPPAHASGWIRPYGDSQTMKYDDIPNLSRESIEEALSRNNSAELLVRCYLPPFIPMTMWAESLCYRLSAHVDSHVRGNVVLGFGHIARRYVRGHAEDTDAGSRSY